MKRYDIFISYRRKGAGDRAEHLKDLLDAKYKDRISFDRENLSGKFAPKLIKRIDTCKDFLLLLSQDSLCYKEKDFEPDKVELYNYLAKCSQADFERKIEELGVNADLDFVRVEVARALQRKDLNIIPIVPQSSDTFKFADLRLPPDIERVKGYEAIFYSDNVDALFKDVVPKIRLHLKSKPDVPMKTLIYLLMVILLIGLAAWGYKVWSDIQTDKQKSELMGEIEACMEEKGIEKTLHQQLSFDPDISIEKLQVVNEILQDMVLVEGGTFMQGAAPNADGTYDFEVCTECEVPQHEQSVSTFYMAQYEVSVKEWCEVMNRSYNPDSCMYPVVDVSFDECKLFVESLRNLSGLNFSLPTESEWECAARGGVYNDTTTFAGASEPLEVANFSDNSRGKILICDAYNYELKPNSLDLFNMSGNVSEWCDTHYYSYDPTIIVPDENSMVIRGGSYTSPRWELAVYHRSPMNPASRAKNVGLRLVINEINL